MKTRPIIMSGESVRAILSGRKTQTRRVVKPRHHWHMDERDDGTPWPYYDGYVYAEPDPVEVRCPHGAPGDRLWVREAWRIDGAWARSPAVVYVADGERSPVPNGAEFSARTATRPSIHMPRWASRLTLEVTGIRVERVQEISDADAVAEGWSGISFPTAWDSINAKRGYPWESNPWVWVVTFGVVK